MAIDIGRGVQRIYIVLSVVWIVFFLILANNMLPSKQKDFYKITDYPCEKIINLWNKGFDTKIKGINGKKIYIYKDKIRKHILYSEILEQPNKYSLFDTTSDGCGLFEYRTLYERLKKTYNILLIAAIPIPLYFILLFIVRGFRKEEK